MMDFLRVLLRAHPEVFWATAYTAGLLVISVVGLVADQREITGINAWIKPIKFTVSVAVFLLTVGWLLVSLEADTRIKNGIGWGIALSLALEISLIVMQAARGVRSHFNVTSAFDGSVFAWMGIAIGVNTVLVAVLLLLWFGPQRELAPAVVWGVRLGLILFLVASAQGVLMVRALAHSVGGPDGGAGLPFLNWSTQFGDLRIAHFVGIHAIQALPIVGWWLSRQEREAGVGWVVAGFGVIALVFLLALLQALAGRPLVRLP
jgi:hypothetical protein